MGFLVRRPLPGDSAVTTLHHMQTPETPEPPPEPRQKQLRVPQGPLQGKSTPLAERLKKWGPLEAGTP